MEGRWIIIIAIVDYGMCNAGSIENMLKKTGCNNVKITDSVSVIADSDKIILPGVGSFDMGMSKLAETGLDSVIKEAACIKKKPVLGICLGMQLLGNGSEEGTMPGLGLIGFHCESLKSKSEKIIVPHIGWEYVDVNKSSKSCPLAKNLPEDPRFYFVHSYHAVCEDHGSVLMTVSLEGAEVTAAVWKENVFGTQFHPEKSHRFGMQLLKNFVENC